MANNLTTDPKFVDPSTFNFALQSGSPAIDAGVATPEITEDFAGIRRPQGQGYDIGAYEHIATLPQQIPPGPTELKVIPK